MTQPQYPYGDQPQQPYGQQPSAHPGQTIGPGSAMQQPAAYGYHPVTGLPYSHKTKLAAGLLSIFFGYFGAGRFYAGHTGLGFAMLIVNIVLTVVSLGMWLFVAWIWPVIDGIVLLAGEPKDKNGLPLR
ncbi:hypothetical protein Rhow_005767 [Rhodococcus wratislaviensis]|uniref:TM2 domain-containing protein n=1 Tax=Rhodococcus wratislaviensis TaxID=44752 RepID=A0A402BZK1_RHOWR|nr:TM2 domain-containing protein [Rhodococcus wratislaviensis]GCE36767.1 hypothetical protein Rhow_005767 [Rhodococcus wratislaviensis]